MGAWSVERRRTRKGRRSGNVTRMTHQLISHGQLTDPEGEDSLEQGCVSAKNQDPRSTKIPYIAKN